MFIFLGDWKCCGSWVGNGWNCNWGDWHGKVFRGGLKWAAAALPFWWSVDRVEVLWAGGEWVAFNITSLLGHWGWRWWWYDVVLYFLLTSNVYVFFANIHVLNGQEIFKSMYIWIFEINKHVFVLIPHITFLPFKLEGCK